MQREQVLRQNEKWQNKSTNHMNMNHTSKTRNLVFVILFSSQVLNYEKLNFWCIVEDQYPDSYPRCRCCGWTSNMYESSLSEHASIFLTICRCRLVLSRASRKWTNKSFVKELILLLHYLLGIHVSSANSKSYSRVRLHLQRFASSFSLSRFLACLKTCFEQPWPMAVSACRSCFQPSPKPWHFYHHI